jgi:serine/threonine protein kinase
MFFDFFIDNSVCAVKIIRKDKGYSPEMSTKLIELEANTMINLGSHPNFVNMIEANKSICLYRKADSNAPNSDSQNKQYVTGTEKVDYMVLEKCENGALSKMIRCTGPLEEEIGRFMFSQL